MGRSLHHWRNLVCWPMMVIIPVSLLAQDTAMLHSTGGVMVNKNQAPASNAIFPDDLIETPQGVMGRIEAPGSTADIAPNTMVQFEGDELVLDHGGLSVNTSRLLRVRVGCVTVTPVNADWTHYDVTDLDGKITISAQKNDVYVDARSSKPEKVLEKEGQPSHSDREIVHEGEQKSREEKCVGPPVKESGRVAGRGAIMNSPYVKWPARVGIAVLTCYALCHSDDPLSPAVP